MARMARVSLVHSQEFSPVCPVDAVAQALWLSSAAFPAHWQGAESETEQPELEPAPKWEAGTVGRGCYNLEPAWEVFIITPKIIKL